MASAGSVDRWWRYAGESCVNTSRVETRSDLPGVLFLTDVRCTMMQRRLRLLLRQGRMAGRGKSDEVPPAVNFQPTDAGRAVSASRIQ